MPVKIWVDGSMITLASEEPSREDEQSRVSQPSPESALMIALIGVLVRNMYRRWKTFETDSHLSH